MISGAAVAQFVPSKRRQSHGPSICGGGHSSSFHYSRLPSEAGAFQSSPVLNRGKAPHTSKWLSQEIDQRETWPRGGRRRKRGVDLNTRRGSDCTAMWAPTFLTLLPHRT